MSIRYVELPGGVKYATDRETKGYRVRWQTPAGLRRDTHRGTVEEAMTLAYDLAGLAMKQTIGRAENDDTPIRFMIDHYLDVCETEGLCNLQTLRSRTSVLNRHVLPVIGSLSCREWDKQATMKVVTAARKGGLADSTIRSLVRTMSSLAHHGVAHQYLAPDQAPVKGLKLDWNAETDLDLPRPEDVEKLALAFVEITGDELAAVAPYLCAYSGLRAGELLGLEAGDFDLEAGTIRLERQVATSLPDTVIGCKYGSERETISPAWMDDLVAGAVERADGGPLFPGTRGSTHMPYGTLLNQRFQPARERAGWPRRDSGRHRWTLHTLRHYFCTWALAKDGLHLDVADVQRLAGHKDPGTTWRIYVQSRPDRASRAREASKEAGR